MSSLIHSFGNRCDGSDGVAVDFGKLVLKVVAVKVTRLKVVAVKVTRFKVVAVEVTRFKSCCCKVVWIGKLYFAIAIY